MTIDAKRARELLDDATDGEWAVSADEHRDVDGAPYDVPCVVRLPSGAPDDDGDLICRGLEAGDAALIAAAPDLARLVLEQDAELERLRTVHNAIAQRVRTLVADAPVWLEALQVKP